MYISKIKLENFKSFVEKHEINLKPGINYFVGNNNSGKTSLFQAIEFIVLGKTKELFITKNSSKDVTVEIELEEVNSENLPEKYVNYVNDGKLVLKRSSKDEVVKQGNKNVNLNIKTCQAWNPETNQFENPFGSGNVVSEIFEPQFIYADLHNEELQDFGSTKPIGKLINSITSDFQKSDEFQKFKKSHDETFGDEGILGELSETENKINNKITEQFGESKIEFNFTFPKVSDFLKNGTIDITENDIKTSANEKGNGLQRALALAILQIISESNSKVEASQMQFCIDEPEIYLHPLAQDKLMNSLKELGSQIFVTTHSPYILRHFRNEEKDSVTILSADIKNRLTKMSTLIFSIPSIGEITYRAFGVPTIDFHQQLFSDLYLKWINEKVEGNKGLSGFDKDFLSQQIGVTSQKFIPRNMGKWNDEEPRSLSYIVRNMIDHPKVLEDEKNIWTEEKLMKSIQEMIAIYENKNNSN